MESEDPIVGEILKHFPPTVVAQMLLVELTRENLCNVSPTHLVA